ncbi:MAG: amidohydrolase [Pseudomonadota bacterium]
MPTMNFAEAYRAYIEPRLSKRNFLKSTIAASTVAAAGTVSIGQASRALAQAEQSSSLPSELTQKIIKSVDQDSDRLTEIFKDIHENPELGFMETRTAGIVAKELEALGYEVKTGIGETGVAGIMRNGDGPVVMFRGDMDAIPTEETTGVTYASKARGTLPDGTETPVGHLCGHDAHTTWMLSVAKTMATFKDSWKGTAVMLGQQSEETLAGATGMVEDGMYSKHGVPKPDFALAMHTAPFPLGTVVGTGGPIMAGSEIIEVTFHGVGGHGSVPQLTKDPVIMATYAIAQYQAIVSRVIDPRDPAVITVGSVQAGSVANVIPETATLKVNTRFFKDSVRDQLFDGITSVSNGIARTYGMPEDKMPTIVRGGRAMVNDNDSELASRTNGALLAAGLVNDKSLVTNFPAVTGSEDFANLFVGVDDMKYAYKFLGIVSADTWAKSQEEGKLVPWSNHNPNFLVDLEGIPLGGKIGSIMVMELMAA